MKRIVLSGPGKNALSIAILEAIPGEVDATGGEPFLLTGAGDAFSAGLNLKEVASLDGPGTLRLLRALEGAIEVLFNHPAPTVACVNGHAVAGGCLLAICCDLVVASADPRVRIGLNETALGLPLPPKLTALVRHRLAPAALQRVLLGGGLHAPSDASALGLVDLVTADPAAVAEQQLEQLAAHPRAAYALHKRQLRAGALMPHASDEQMFAEVFPLWASDETRRRAAATLKRA